MELAFTFVPESVCDTLFSNRVIDMLYVFAR